ncbi:MAG TPA: hypothetical protein GXX69_05475 [Firmicutes bacterium]|nr:hypothetical protein [Bacillota bacterium]
MFGAIFELIKSWVGLCLAGLAIKFLDDYLDQEEDDTGNLTLAVRLGPGVLAYALLLYALGTQLSQWSFSIFLASYACGMLGTNDWLLPIGTPAWLETAVVLLLGLVLCGWNEMLSSFLMILGIHLLDDVIDTQIQGTQAKTNNLVHQWGRVETLILGILLTLLSLLSAPIKTTLTWLALPVVLYIASNPQIAGKR